MTLFLRIPLRLWRLLRGCWSASDFDEEDMARFAQSTMSEEARSGIFFLGLLSMLLMAGLAVLYSELGFGGAHLYYTFGLLGLLALHIALSAKMITSNSDARVFYLLGIALLALVALAVVLLAHRSNLLDATLLSSAGLLFMVVPLVPWGFREALFAVSTVYVIFTGSTLNTVARFGEATLWTLQFLMVGAAVVALALVARATVLRKQHLQARFRLTQTNVKLAQTALQDPLTGAWNRRFLEERYDKIVAGYAASGRGYCLALVDVDDFKRVNDTYGHTQGDRVLQHVSDVLEHSLAPGEFLIRIGGDEFLLLLQGADVCPRLENIAGSIERRGASRSDNGLMPGLSIGIAQVRPGIQVALEDLYALADEAMYGAKTDASHPVVEVCFVDKGNE